MIHADFKLSTGVFVFANCFACYISGPKYVQMLVHSNRKMLVFDITLYKMQDFTTAKISNSKVLIKYIESIDSKLRRKITSIHNELLMNNNRYLGFEKKTSTCINQTENSFTSQNILVVVCSRCGTVHSGSLNCSVLLVVEVTNNLAWFWSRLTRNRIVDRDDKHPVQYLNIKNYSVD